MVLFLQKHNQKPLFSKFPAYGVFLLKRPKGTKSRRWARGLQYARRELPHGMHLIHWPANLVNSPIFSSGRNSALCSGSTLDRPRVRKPNAYLKAAIWLGEVYRRCPRRYGQPQGLPLQIQIERVRWLGGGFFRVDPFRADVLAHVRESQATELHSCH